MALVRENLLRADRLAAALCSGAPEKKFPQNSSSIISTTSLVCCSFQCDREVSGEERENPVRTDPDTVCERLATVTTSDLSRPAIKYVSTMSSSLLRYCS